MMKPETLTIDPEFKALIPPLAPEEYQQLEANILADGCRDAITRWERTVIDGHNRYEICHRHGQQFRTTTLEFKSREEVKLWIIRNQFGRRNLSAAIRASLALKLKGILAEQAKGRMLAGKADPTDKCREGETNDQLGKIAGVSGKTIERMEKIEKSPVVELGRMARAGEVSINAAAKVAAFPPKEQEEAVAAGPEGVKAKAKESPNAPKVRGCGLDWGHKAIGMLQKIPQDDGLRNEALELVVRWCKHNKNTKEAT